MKPSVSRLDDLRKHIRSRLLPDELGYTAWVEGHKDDFGTCWGDSRDDAVKAIELWVLDHHMDPLVARALE